MHMTVLVELPGLVEMSEAGVDAALERAMAPFYSDCGLPIDADQQKEIAHDESEIRLLCTEHRGHRWDWYVIGGRYRDYFVPVQGVPDSEMQSGQPGVPESMAILEGTTTLVIEGADVIRKRDIDWEAMAAKRRRDAEKSWEEGQAATDAFLKEYSYGIKPGDTRETYLERHSVPDFSTYAVLKADGEWIESERFIFVADPTPENASRFEKMPNWPQVWEKLVADMPADSILCLVDYHN